MLSEHSIEPFAMHHLALLSAAEMSGVDTSPCVNGERFIGYGDTKTGYGPACILDIVSTPYVSEPHVTWFPWTTPANRIVNFKWAMDHLAETKQVFLAVAKKESHFFEHFVKRGVLRKVGFINNLPEIEEVHMYQYERKLG